MGKTFLDKLSVKFNITNSLFLPYLTSHKTINLVAPWLVHREVVKKETTPTLKLGEGYKYSIRPSVPVFAVKWCKSRNYPLHTSLRYTKSKFQYNARMSLLEHVLSS